MKDKELPHKGSDRLYELVDRLHEHSKIKYPERPWSHTFYYDCAFAWMGKEDELEKQVLKLEAELKQLNGKSTTEH